MTFAMYVALSPLPPLSISLPVARPVNWPILPTTFRLFFFFYTPTFVCSSPPRSERRHLEERGQPLKALFLFAYWPRNVVTRVEVTVSRAIYGRARTRKMFG